MARIFGWELGGGTAGAVFWGSAGCGLDLLAHQLGIFRLPPLLGTFSVLLSISSKRAAASLRLFVAIGAPRNTLAQASCPCFFSGITSLYLSSVGFTRMRQRMIAARGGGERSGNPHFEAGERGDRCGDGFQCRREEDRIAAGERDAVALVAVDDGLALEDDPDAGRGFGEGKGLAGGHLEAVHGKVRRFDEAGEAGIGAFKLCDGGGMGGKVDAFKGLVNVECARFAIVAEAVPVEDAEGGVGGGLDLGGDDSLAQGVDGAAGEVMTVALADADGIEEGFDLSGVNCVLELGLGHAGFETFVDTGAGLGVEDVPCFGFQMGPGVGVAIGLVGMDLDGEVLMGVEEFDEEGEISGGGPGQGEGGVLYRLAQRGAGEGAIGDDAGEGAIGLGACGISLDRSGGEVSKFPGFTEGLTAQLGGNWFGEQLVESASPPEPLLIHSPKFERIHRWPRDGGGRRSARFDFDAAAVGVADDEHAAELGFADFAGSELVAAEEHVEAFEVAGEEAQAGLIGGAAFEGVDFEDARIILAGEVDGPVAMLVLVEGHAEELIKSPGTLDVGTSKD